MTTQIGIQNALSVTTATAVGLTFPTTGPKRPTHAIIQVTQNSIRWRADGGTPDATTGILVPANANIEFMDLADHFIGVLKSFKAIGISGTALLEVAYFLE